MILFPSCCITTTGHIQDVLTSFYLFQFTCGHFKKCNEWLAERYGEDGRIDWSLIPNKTILGPTAVAPERDMSVSANGQESRTSIESSSNSKKMNGEVALKTVEKDDTLSDEDDIDALEALVAAEDSLENEHHGSLDKLKDTGSEPENQ
jgi:hypothetical protein